MKKLPLGTHTFKNIILENNVYVDKTKYIFDLIDGNSKYYFLSRPRRFGKSLLISTLESLFLNQKELFKDLWIYNKIEWQEYPVIKIDFSSISYDSPESLRRSLNNQIIRISENYKVKLNDNNDYKDNFKDLIIELSKKNKVVILIDEYDKPIIDFIDNQDIASKNRSILKYFYETIKACDEYIRFVFLTGVSKFSKVSVFSGLNNLQDITIDDRFSTMLGYTESELHSYLADHINELSKTLNISQLKLKEELKSWYNGYSWDGKNFVYNPFSILTLFTKQKFGNYWFTSGTPNFLIKQIRKYNTNMSELEHFEAISSMFDTFDIDKINVHSLLFQTGYLTIKQKINLSLGLSEYVLSYPNLEVKESLINHVLGDLLATL